MTKIALIGCGGWGTNIARALGKTGTLAVICDPDRARAEPLARSLNAEWVADFHTVLTRSEIAAVVVATPAVTHATIAGEAFKAGKHVFVEKPLSLDLADAQGVARKARAAGKTLFVGHLLQYHPAFVALRASAARGDIGDVRYIYSNRLNPGRIRGEENALWSLAPHDFSMIYALAGGEPKRITASGVDAVQPGIADLATVQMDFGPHLRAHIFVSWLSPYKEHRLTVLGTTGALIFEDTAVEPANKLKIYRGYVARDDAVPAFCKSDGEAIPFDAREPLLSEMQAFIHCVETGAAAPTGEGEAIPVLQGLLAAQAAMDGGRAVDPKTGS